MSSGRMTTLQAVNKILRGLGEPRVSALDTGGTSLEAEAEAMLDELTQEVQAEGWFSGATEEYEMKVPLISIAASGGTGAFTYDELVEESTSGATGVFKFIDSSIHLVHVSGTFTGGETLTGQASGATRTGGALSQPTSNYLHVNTAWVRVVPNDREWLDIQKRGDQLYDMTNQTALFSASVWLDVTRELYFTDLPYNLANYVTMRAAYEFQLEKKRGRVDVMILKEKMQKALVEAQREDDDLRRTNTLDTAEARAVRGNRYLYPQRRVF